MSDLQTRLQQAADEAARHGRPSGPATVIRRGRQRRRRLIGGTASLVVLVLVAGAVGTGRLASRQTPLAPAPTTSSPTTTSVTRIPAAVKKVVPLDVQVHLGPAGFPDRRTGSSCCRPASCPRPSAARASWQWSVERRPGCPNAWSPTTKR